jgi:hypothetical protein
MSVQFLLFVIAVLLFAIFWELCKINSQIKKRLPIPPKTLAGGQANEAVPKKPVD